MALPRGIKLGSYEIVSSLGAGGMGEVYRARDESLGRDVAIKVLPKELASDPDRLRRFEQEARAAAALNHPNILAVYGFSTTEEHAPYLVTELLQGQTLRERLRQGDIPVRKAVEFALQTARGLAAAHYRGIVHRDLKPENLFLTRDGVVKILDFGLAKLIVPEVRSETSAATASFTEVGVVVGTAGYMSPEQVRAQVVDQRSDTFSLGAILYEMLSGKRAFEGKTAADTMSAILKEEPAELSASGRIFLRHWGASLIAAWKRIRRNGFNQRATWHSTWNCSAARKQEAERRWHSRQGRVDAGGSQLWVRWHY